MIVFDLRCATGHVFEAWFASSAAWEAQRDAGQVACPTCGDCAVTKAVMAPNVAPKGSGIAPDPRVLITRLAEAQRAALKSSRWVGRDFAATARAIHDGERPAETVHGQATVAEARSLIDEGVAVAPLPFPVVPPESLN